MGGPTVLRKFMWSLFVLMCACGKPCEVSQTKERLALEAMDRFIPGAMARIQRAPDAIEWRDEAFYCNGTGVATGCQGRGKIIVVCEFCIADTALVHEYVHAYLGGDPGHTNELWTLVSQINADLRKNACN